MNTTDRIAIDFSRNVWCLLGLPFDAVNLQQACDAILLATKSKQPCFLSTPNLNFLCAAQTDKAFRQSVINSELSIADGFPIVLIAKLLRIPIAERVAGSDLIDQLYRLDTNPPMKVFFLGGADGVGEQAIAKVNARPAGITAVGSYTPGFGSVEDMSTQKIIDYVNQHDIDFLIVSLGAKKGQAWIEFNRNRLKAQVISHLGAVINFFAGTVKRAPKLAQRFGLEWLWRIYQEPSLWRRYYEDGKNFIGLLCNNILPYWLWLTFNGTKYKNQAVTVELTNHSDGTCTISLTGDCIKPNLQPILQVFKDTATEKNCDVVLDLTKVTTIDSAFLGSCLLFYKHLNYSGHKLQMANPSPSVSKILKWQVMLDFVINR